MMAMAYRLMLALGILVLVALPALADEPSARLLGDQEAGASTGSSVALDGTFAVVGAPNTGANRGAAYIYEENQDGTWRRAASITGLGGNGARAGTSVAVSSPRAVIGVPGRGEAAIFTRVDGFWLAGQTLEGEPGFGTEVAVEGSVVLVSTIDEDLNGTVSVFENGPDGGWPLIATLTSPEASLFDRFGDALAIDGNTITVGAPADSIAASGAGAVHVFNRINNAWQRTATVYPSDPVRQGAFGRSISMDAGRMAVGSDEGVYIFLRNNAGFWVQETKLSATVPGGLFGFDVALVRDRLAVGSPTAGGEGQVVVWDRQRSGEWISAGTLSAVPDPDSPGAFFGASVAMGEEMLLVGRPGTSNTYVGGADVYGLPLMGEPPPLGPVNDAVGMFDPATGLWAIPADAPSFYYGVPGDIPLMGDWDCDGSETVGMFRPSNGFAYLRNSNDFGIADVSFFLGIAGDIPLAGDWNDDGCDTLAVFRQGLVLVRNTLTTGFADEVFFYGLATDTPITGDWDGNGTTDIGAYRPSNGFVYLRNSRTTGVADLEFFFGRPDDVVIAGDWDDDGDDTIGVLRPGERTVYLSYENETRVADERFLVPAANQIPIAFDRSGS